ncbi:3D domain-containing protein [Lacrimispora sp.]|jgi:3D (Asp-Asp-Asp) domain-containing protein|uniref:3D domain-containing protein n=1 Tax=Lacrimispora sp. TaxID=2719234 RepID=UPI0028A5E88A|nr:3D domain-containing protein [Lacrimispora sp.]
MKRFSGKLRITGLLTILCILLLSTSAMADEAVEKEQTTADAQSASVQTIKSDAKSESSTESTKASEETGPGVKKETEPTKTEPTGPVYEKGASLGLFSATAYCPSKSGKIGRTYSGTTPRAQHTLSADLTILPIGTMVMIDDVIYTVEDTGSGIRGNKVDIFFGSRDEAINFGRQTKEIFAVNVN